MDSEDRTVMIGALIGAPVGAIYGLFQHGIGGAIVGLIAGAFVGGFVLFMICSEEFKEWVFMALNFVGAIVFLAGLVWVIQNLWNVGKP